MTGQLKTINLARPGLLLVVWQLLICLVLSAMATPAEAAPANPPTLTATAAIAVDFNSGRILYAKNVHRRLAMASTTKIMTALTALSVEGTTLTETYQVVKEDLVGEASMGLRNGETLSFQDLLYGMLLNSGNDAATAIARYAGAKLPGGGDPVARFVGRMNQYAGTLGLRNSHYANPHGLDQAEHYSSAFDLAITGWYALKHPLLSKIIATQSATVAGHNLANLNKLLGRYAGANGVKPGFTDNAGLCLIGAALRDGQQVIGVTMGDDARGYQVDPPAVLDYAFEQLKQPDVLKVIQQGATAATASDYIGRPNGDKLAVFQEVGNQASVVNNGPNGQVVDAQINQTQGQGTPSTTVTTQSGDSAGSGGDGANKKEGGFNLLGLLFFLLIATGIIYCLLRFTPLGGDRGKEIAYQMEDLAAKGLHLGQRVWSFVRPGPHEEEPTLSANSGRPERERTEVVRGSQTTADTIQVKPSRYSPEVKPAQPTQRLGEVASQSIRRTTASNPLENIFDDVAPFSFDDNQPAKTVGHSVTEAAQPPRPLSTANRTTPEPPRPVEPPVEQTRAVRPPQPISPVTPPPARAGTGPDAPPTPARTPSPGIYDAPPAPSSARTTRPAGSADGLQGHARQAIDYAYAGRMMASQEEFRRVVEQDPKFDFGIIEEFERMPVLGYKALATAYRDVGRLKFALLLLDMAIETYPNELELRNMQRTFRRDSGS